jgi:hypothetical protein
VLAPPRSDLHPELLDLAVVCSDRDERNDRRKNHVTRHPVRKRQLSAGAASKPKHERSTNVGPDAEDPPDLVTLSPTATDAHVRDVLAVITNNVVSKLRLESKQELSALYDLPPCVSRWMMACEPTVASVAYDSGRSIAFEVLKRHSVDHGVGLVPDAAAKLDDPIIADVDAVMVIEHGAPDLEVVAPLESVVHVIRSYQASPRPGRRPAMSRSRPEAWGGLVPAACQNEAKTTDIEL